MGEPYRFPKEIVEKPIRFPTTPHYPRFVMVSGTNCRTYPTCVTAAEYTLLLARRWGTATARTKPESNSEPQVEIQAAIATCNIIAMRMKNPLAKVPI